MDSSTSTIEITNDYAAHFYDMYINEHDGKHITSDSMKTLLLNLPFLLQDRVAPEVGHINTPDISADIIPDISVFTPDITTDIIQIKRFLICSKLTSHKRMALRTHGYHNRYLVLYRTISYPISGLILFGFTHMFRNGRLLDDGVVAGRTSRA